jgi:hypothetical protein
VTGVGRGNSPASHHNAKQWDSHMLDALVEDVEFLCGPGGLLFEDACKRVGKSVDAVEKLLARRGRPVPRAPE